MQAGRDIRMVRAEGLFANDERAFEQWFRLSVFALIQVQESQVVQAVRHVRMVRAQRLLANCQRPFVQGLRLGVFALMLGTSQPSCSGWSRHPDGPGRGPFQELRATVCTKVLPRSICAEFRTAQPGCSGWSRHPDVPGRGPFQELRASVCTGFGLGVFSLSCRTKIARLFRLCRDIRMVRAEGLLTNCQRPFIQGLRLGVFALIVVQTKPGCSGCSRHPDGPGRGPSREWRASVCTGARPRRICPDSCTRKPGCSGWSRHPDGPGQGLSHELPATVLYRGSASAYLP